MQESYGEGLAAHIGPESCATDPEDGREALGGGCPYAHYYVHRLSLEAPLALSPQVRSDAVVAPVRMRGGGYG